ncbi:hypothetical protein K7X08_036211 [Anisodus acutangulus]|uniref:Glycoside hydrolase family 3 C-terminal domain-containing protein n=1 Tax=Anisodus acutangulus TaxID=402998 RepID=A0A9Q1QW15_9SOLA|nr:hypothetical protein K7X08_036211 [Anisodus acutangulus]
MWRMDYNLAGVYWNYHPRCNKVCSRSWNRRDSPTLTMTDPGPDVINNVCQSVKCVVIVISGRPLVIEPYLPSIDALVAAWLPGTEGQGITDLLFGDYRFTGKLPRTWFRTVDQLPMNVGDPHYDPLFPFGFGLTTSKSTVARSVSAGAAGRPYVLGIMVSVIIAKQTVFSSSTTSSCSSLSEVVTVLH